MHEQEWKLINRSIKDGYVYLDTDEAVRLIRNELSNLIYTRIKNMKVYEVPILIKSKADELRKNIQGATFTEINSRYWSILRALNMLWR